jgi:hypothetical protein
MNWLSFVNAVVGIVLIVLGASGMVGNHMVAIAVVIGGLIVLALGALRWITGFGRFSSEASRPIPH